MCTSDKFLQVFGGGECLQVTSVFKREVSSSDKCVKCLMVTSV